MSDRVLIACEESQAVTIAMRERGIEAYSCDIEPCSGGHPEWHLQQDVIPLLQEDWAMVIAFPPCTHLCVSGAKWFEQKRKDGRQQEGVDFFMTFTDIPCQRVAIENPVGIMSSLWRTPDQIIQPFWFGDSLSKKTCLWLKGLPRLNPQCLFAHDGPRTRFASGKTMPTWYEQAGRLSPAERARLRSKTFPGIAQAMADQWGALVAQGARNV